LRSGSTTGSIPHALTVLWTAAWSGRPEGVIADDWRSNYFIRGPVGPPVAANGMVFVTRPDVHQVVALHAATGRTAWTFTANGRVDTAPTIHRGLCLFGSKSGWVYCLRADTGAMVWRLRAAPFDERIVAYGQLESPWPVPGSVLVAEDVAYFAAGRQSLADGGILVFAVEPATGAVRWVQRLDGVPQKDFYGSSGLEFDNFDLLQCEGPAVGMSRWLFDRKTGRISCRATSGFVQLANGGASVLFPRGSWSYAPRNEAEQWKERPYVRPLAVFRGGALYGCSQDRQTVFRRDFHLDSGEKFDAEWFAGWDTYSKASKGGDLWRTQRIARGATWSATPFSASAEMRTVSGLILAGDVLCVAAAQGRLALLNVKDGSPIREIPTPPPAWDGLAAAEGRLFLTTQAGGLICLGSE
jgi:outer membrane protein assembly factor BamB